MTFRDFFEAAIDEQYPFKAVFTSGGPGSGKSFIVSNMLTRFGFKFANSDEILLRLARKQGQPELIKANFGDPDYGLKQKLASKSMDLSVKRVSNWQNSGIPYVIDITGRNVGLVNNINHQLNDIGYDTYMVFVRTSLETALKRNKSRGEAGAHVVDDEFLKDAHKAAGENLREYRTIFGRNLIVVDNDEDVNGRVDQNRLNRQLDRVARQLLGNFRNVQNPIGRLKLAHL